MGEKRKPAQQLADRSLVVIDAEAALDQHLQLDAAPADEAIDLGFWTRLEEGGKLGLLLSVQPRYRTGRPCARPTPKGPWH